MALQNNYWITGAQFGALVTVSYMDTSVLIPPVEVQIRGMGFDVVNLNEDEE